MQTTQIHRPHKCTDYINTQITQIHRPHKITEPHKYADHTNHTNYTVHTNRDYIIHRQQKKYPVSMSVHLPWAWPRSLPDCPPVAWSTCYPCREYIPASSWRPPGLICSYLCNQHTLLSARPNRHSLGGLVQMIYQHQVTQTSAIATAEKRSRRFQGLPYEWWTEAVCVDNADYRLTDGSIAGLHQCKASNRDNNSVKNRNQ